ncbi:ribonuclease inhibitor [Microbacterium esteraromaticum]|uniref:Ribonuclease inhibitor n=1 Tax=Microbacterium esteraromaticum TaxID=57043 RepID=A0A7D8AKC8_9MICO|nr:ribonuclease inhibitor [Microbacterium esteraromaticum]QMU97629.1 ribonuclease inhibitor [Microbacterium esteraromaticum]
MVDDASRVFRIEGDRIDTIDDLYAQLNALLMADEDWTLGSSLDALDDVLYQFDTNGAVFVWADHEHSRESLGLATTRRWLEDKLSRPDIFNAQGIRHQRDALLRGEGKTYFEIVQEIFASHRNVRLELR